MTLNNTFSPEAWTYNVSSGAHPATHFALCNTISKTEKLPTDGYEHGGFSDPPAPFNARMWAGGEITFHAPLLLGDSLARTTTMVQEPEFKQGRSGEFIRASVKRDFLSMQHQAAPLVSERIDYVFRDSTASKLNVSAPKTTVDNASPLQQGTDFDFERAPMPLDEVTLFRYSALTSNAHRIHYDKDYARAEGYPDVLVHGPLQATLLLDLAGDVSAGICPSEPALSTAVVERIRAEVDALNASQADHGHGHSHGGEECSGHHEPVEFIELPWHSRFQHLASFKYRALRPLVAKTPVRVLAKVVDDQHKALEPGAAPENTRALLRNGPARVRMWVQDANDNDVVYMEAEAVFATPALVQYSGIPEEQLDILLREAMDKGKSE
jgi:hydroxyacyl-ACP dehydratase HTD2-like protein with hotdog domain